jgi:hypothetical protein
VVVILTIGAQLHESNEQAKRDFELAAAEIVMNTDSPAETRAKAEALKTLFSGRLPEGFAANFDPDNYSEKPVTRRKDRLLGAVLEHPDQAVELIGAWILFNPEDAVWASDILERIR